MLCMLAQMLIYFAWRQSFKNFWGPLTLINPLRRYLWVQFKNVLNLGSYTASGDESFVMICITRTHPCATHSSVQPTGTAQVIESLMHS